MIQVIDTSLPTIRLTYSSLRALTLSSLQSSAPLDCSPAS